MAEFLGALTGDRGSFKKKLGSGKTGKAVKPTRYVTKICVGIDREWGYHLSNLVYRDYGVRGSVFWDKNEWRYQSNSARLYEDLHHYFRPEWNARCWGISPLLFACPFEIRQAFIRGYFDADGYPYFSRARDRVYVQVNSVNLSGLVGRNRLFVSLGFHPGLYRRYKKRDVWELTVHRKEDVFRFYDEIGFSTVRKQDKLREMLARKWPKSLAKVAREGFEPSLCGSLGFRL